MDLALQFSTRCIAAYGERGPNQGLLNTSKLGGDCRSRYFFLRNVLLREGTPRRNHRLIRKRNTGLGMDETVGFVPSGATFPGPVSLTSWRSFSCCSAWHRFLLPGTVHHIMNFELRTPPIRLYRRADVRLEPGEPTRCRVLIRILWWALEDSNLRPQPCEGCALTN